MIDPVYRVALIPSLYLPSLGGVEELTRHLALSLKAEGTEVEVWAPYSPDADRAPSEVLDGILVRRFEYPLPSATPGAVVRTIPDAGRTLKQMREAVGSFQPDVLHVQCFGPNGAYATALSAITGIPLVITLQGETVMDNHDVYDHSTALRWSLRAGLLRARAVTGCSAFTLADSERRFGLRPGKGEVIFNGTVVSENAREGAEATIRSSDLGTERVLALGRLVDKKGFDLLLEAFAEVAKRRPNAVLQIGGEGPAKKSLESLVADLGLQDRVEFLGRLGRDEVAQAMAAATVFCMPSRVEPFGIVILEAWRAGAPVVATNMGGPPEFVDHDVDGVLVRPTDRSALAAAVVDLLEDPDKRRSLAEAGRRRVGDFAWSRIAEQYEDVYRRITANRLPSRPSPVTR